MKVERLSDGSVIKRLERAGRKCGDCRLCCKLLAVGKDGRDDFKKPQGEWCTHCFDGGCRIYATRPPDCEEYECTWFAGVFEDDDRPDKSKVVVSLEHGDSVRGPDGREVAGPTPVWCVYESIPGVTLKGRAKAIVDELSTLVIEETPGEFRGPFPICIIPSRSHTRTVKFPGQQRWIPMLRPGEIDPRRDHTGPAVRVKPPKRRKRA